MTKATTLCLQPGKAKFSLRLTISHPGIIISPFTSAPNEMINTYYSVSTNAEVERILRDGFINEYKETTTGISGVYLANSPGEPDPEYPDDQLLEITLPPEISISQFEVFKKCKENTPWREWVLPAGLLNECGEVHLVPKVEWGERWRQWVERSAEPIIIKLCGAILSVFPHSISRKGRRVLFYRTGRELGRVQPPPGSGCESRTILAAYVEFKKELHALNLETRVRLKQQIEIESEHLKRFLIVTDVPCPDSPGKWVTLMKGWTDKEEQMPLPQLTKYISSKMRHGTYTLTGGKINPDPDFLTRMSDDHYRKNILNELVAEGLLYIDCKRDGEPVYHMVPKRKRRSGRN